MSKYQKDTRRIGISGKLWTPEKVESHQPIIIRFCTYKNTLWLYNILKFQVPMTTFGISESL